MQEERKFVIQGIFIAIGIVFLIRLFYLQVLDGSYKYAADNNVSTSMQQTTTSSKS